MRSLRARVLMLVAGANSGLADPSYFKAADDFSKDVASVMSASSSLGIPVAGTAAAFAINHQHLVQTQEGAPWRDTKPFTWESSKY